MAQISLSGKFQILSRSATGTSDYNLIGLFSDDLSRFASTDVKVNDRVIDLAGNIYRIVAINSNASLMNIDVEDIEASGLPNTGGGAIQRPVGCNSIDVPAAGLSNDLLTIITHNAYIKVADSFCGNDYCDYTASVDEVTGATFEGIAINGIFYTYTGTPIVLTGATADEEIETFVNGVGLGVFEINGYTISPTGTTYTISSFNENTVNFIRHNDGSDNDTVFVETCSSGGGGLTINGYYDTHEDALAGGVTFDELFKLTNNNPYGMVEGSVVAQILVS